MAAMRLATAAAAVVAVLPVAASSPALSSDEPLPVEADADDECRVGGAASDSDPACAQQLLQRAARRNRLSEHEASAGEWLPPWAQVVTDLAPPSWTPPWMHGSSPSPSHTATPSGGDEGEPQAPAPVPGFDGASAPAPAPVRATGACAALTAADNANCKETVDWVANGGGKYDPDASVWFEDMKSITGVTLEKATENDFQRLYFCSPPGGKACGSAPCHCSKPPCDTCFGGAPPRPKRAGCTDASNSIECTPPKRPMDYKGMAWPELTFHGAQEMHIFCIGDWGGMDGSLNPIEGRPDIVAYDWGKRKGPSVFPRTRWNRYHTVELCSHKQFIQCFNTHGDDCPESCGYVKGVDDQPQQVVAKALQQRAQLKDPQFFLNVGDNFYWGGIEKKCGTPMDQISYTAHHQFDQVFEQVYTGPGLDGKPWFSVLGNHDWGGRQFNNGWDQQIAYTWASTRWVMPAPYYMVHVNYPTKAFSVDLFMIDSNVHDAKPPLLDSEHNICGSAHNPPDADCTIADGPQSVESCPGYFQDLWNEQKAWLEGKMSESRADWQVVVTHFPCGEDGENQAWYRKLRKTYGLDLMVTGHRHDQELWLPTDTHRNFMGGLTCIVTGGGGGITSEATPDPENKADWYGEGEYGFFDITVDKYSMTVESINWDGTVLKTATVYPS